jgi:hypothetical protein
MFTRYSAICIARGLAAGDTLTCLDLEQESPTRWLATRGGRTDTDRVEIRVGPAEGVERAPYDFGPLPDSCERRA